MAFFSNKVIQVIIETQAVETTNDPHTAVDAVNHQLDKLEFLQNREPVGKDLHHGHRHYHWDQANDINKTQSIQQETSFRESLGYFGNLLI